MITRTDAIGAFLIARTRPDLAALYHRGMEVQVNVAQDGGERVDGDYRGRHWHGFSDGLSTWKSFRVPFGANSEPHYTDQPMSFDIAAHTDAIGMTGWCWTTKTSRWFAYDFDAITGHSPGHNRKLTAQQLSDIEAAVSTIEWVTLRKSTSGSGLHIYVFIDNLPTNTHTEHAAAARAVLGKLSALTGYDLISAVDICGGNMWIWARKMVGTDGLTVIKQGTEIPLSEIPSNWKDHIKVVTGHRRRTLPQEIGESNESAFDQLTGQRPDTVLDADHRRLVDYLNDKCSDSWWWDQDRKMLVCHTYWLAQAHEALGLKGFFKTASVTHERGDYNCFCFPLAGGAWSVRRYSLGCTEHSYWDQDTSGFTYCYLNRHPNLASACRAIGGVEDSKGGFVFSLADDAIQAAGLLGVVIEVPNAILGRQAVLRLHKDGRLICDIDRQPSDDGGKMVGWLAEGKKPWSRIFKGRFFNDEPEMGVQDEIVRHLVSIDGEDMGWRLFAESVWRTEPLPHIKMALQALGQGMREITQMLGSNVFTAWTRVNLPFEDEYPGGRKWNIDGAKLAWIPSTNESLSYKHWQLILRHIGSELDTDVRSDPWCKLHSITTGSDYLICWIAALIQCPTEPLPYLFLYGSQDCGKSILHEALSELFTSGYVFAEQAIKSGGGFNKEIESGVLCVIEETNLRQNEMAYNRIKNWVTAKKLLIHGKGLTPYHVQNTTHWIQCDNDHNACPIFPGDTRIVMVHVPDIAVTDMIPKRILIPALIDEAPAFLAAILHIDLPPTPSRLRIPVLETSIKAALTSSHTSALQLFIDDKIEYAPGYCISVADFHVTFKEWAEQEGGTEWTKHRIVKEMSPDKFPKGRWRKNASHYFGNMKWWGSDDKPMFDGRVIKQGDFLGTVP